MSEATRAEDLRHGQPTTEGDVGAEPAGGIRRESTWPSRSVKGAACGTARPSASPGACAPVRQTSRSPRARKRRPPKVTSSAATPAGVAEQPPSEEVGRDVGGAGAADPHGEVAEPAEVLHEGQRPGLDDLDAAGHRGASTKRTVVPGMSSAGGCRSTSQSDDVGRPDELPPAG